MSFNYGTNILTTSISLISLTNSNFINFTNQIVSVHNETYKNNAYSFEKCSILLNHCLFKYVGYHLFETHSAPIALINSNMNTINCNFILCFGDAGVIKSENSKINFTNTNFSSNQIDTCAGVVYMTGSSLFSEYCYFFDNVAPNVGVLFSLKSQISLRASALLFNVAEKSPSAILMVSCNHTSFKRTYFIKNKIINNYGFVLETENCNDIYMNVVQFVDNFCISEGIRGNSIKISQNSRLSLWYCLFDNFVNETVVADKSSQFENQESGIQYYAPRRFAEILNNHFVPLRRIVSKLNGVGIYVAYIFIITISAFIISVLLALHRYVSPIF